VSIYARPTLRYTDRREHYNMLESADCVSVAGGKRRCKTDVRRGEPPSLTRLHTLVILTAAEILDHALNDLSAEQRTLVEAHVLDHQSVHTLVRRRGVPKRDIERALAAAFEAMRYALVRRGIRGFRECL
jgi:DNA-directed RNA polymerase specialized sigma24 family protein